MNKSDLHYLKSILSNLREMRTMAQLRDDTSTLGLEALDDNIDWLDCFIDKQERRKTK